MRRVGTLKPQGLHLVESMRKQLATNNNQGCGFSHMTKRQVREWGLVWWRHEATKGPSTIYLPVQPSLTCNSRACLSVDKHFWHLASIPGRKKRKRKGQKAHTSWLSTFWEHFPQLLLTSQWPDLGHLVIIPRWNKIGQCVVVFSL